MTFVVFLNPDCHLFFQNISCLGCVLVSYLSNKKASSIISPLVSSIEEYGNGSFDEDDNDKIVFLAKVRPKFHLCRLILYYIWLLFLFYLTLPNLNYVVAVLLVALGSDFM